MTVKLYLNDTYLFKSNASLLHYGEDEKGLFLILNQTIFYPQGGGQPSDQGLIKNDFGEVKITLVRQVEDEIRHYYTALSGQIFVDSTITCQIDQDRRILNSKFHTAAHLLGNVVEIIHPTLKAIKGHSFPGEAYVEFQGEADTDKIQIQNIMNEEIAKNHQTKIFEIDQALFEKQFYKLPYNIPQNKKFRIMQIGNMLPVPCGGTHLSFIKEIGQIIISKIKLKNNISRIYYQLY